MQTLFFIGQNPSLLGETQVAGDLGWVARFFFKRARFLVFIPLVI